METRTVSWLALLVAVLALIIAWVAYNRASDVSLLEEVRQESAEAVGELRREAARMEASARLQALENNAELQRDSARFEAEVNAIQADLRAAYRDADAESQQELAELEGEFDELEVGIRSGTANMLASLERLIGNLRADVRSDAEDTNE